MLTSLPVVRASEVSLFFACAHVPRSRSRSCYSYLDYFLCLCWTLIYHFPEYTYLCGRKWPARHWTLGAGFPRMSIIPDIGAPTKTAGSCPLPSFASPHSQTTTSSPQSFIFTTVVHFRQQGCRQRLQTVSGSRARGHRVMGGVANSVDHCCPTLQIVIKLKIIFLQQCSPSFSSLLLHCRLCWSVPTLDPSSLVSICASSCWGSTSRL